MWHFSPMQTDVGRQHRTVETQRPEFYANICTSFIHSLFVCLFSYCFLSAYLVLLCQTCGYNSKQRKLVIYYPYHCEAYGLQQCIVCSKHIIYTEFYNHKSQIGSETSSTEFWKFHSGHIFMNQRNHRGVRKQDTFKYLFIYLFSFLWKDTVVL